VWLGRAGFVARGLIYLTVGLLAGLAAGGIKRGETTDAKGAVTTIDQLPWGTPLVVLAGLGLAGYAVWRMTQAVLDPEHLRTGRHGRWMRVLFGLDALLHAVFAFTVFSVALGRSRGDGEAEADDWTAAVLSQPFGAWLVGIGGALAIAGGLYLFYRTFTVRYCEGLQKQIEDKWQSTAFVTAARIGESARGVVFVVVGAFLLRAAWTLNPEETKGLAGALQALGDQPGGPLWLGLIAFGFVAFGVMSLLEARYRRIGPPG
jgi:hypothetical protein